jgi:hypothetical protein
MNIRFKINDKKENVKFDPIQTVLTPDLYLLIYSYKAKMFLDTVSLDETNVFSLFHLSKVHHVIYGEMKFNNTIFEIQVGAITDKVCSRGFDLFLMRHFPYDGQFESVFEPYEFTEDVKHLIIEYSDFAKVRELLEMPTLNFKEYTNLLLKYSEGKVNNFILADETSLFNVVSKDFDLSKLITIRGFDIYRDELRKKA